MGLRTGCLPMAVEVGRYTGTSFSSRVCRLCNYGEVEDQHHFLGATTGSPYIVFILHLSYGFMLRK